MIKRRDDLIDASLYAEVKGRFGHKQLAAQRQQWVPSEVFEPDYHLRMRTVSDCLWDYFDHLEMKSRGENGVLPRLITSGFNPALLSGLDMDVLSKRVGVAPHTLRRTFSAGGGLSRPQWRGFARR